MYEKNKAVIQQRQSGSERKSVKTMSPPDFNKLNALFVKIRSLSHTFSIILFKIGESGYVVYA